ncbi:MAG: heat shock protein HspQ [Candidatus Binatia bacterium]|nr:heat shock protein HspQ [Candidatus Binatia bacterium]
MDDHDGKYAIGQVVRHRIYPFRGVIFDVDPIFNHTEEWWESIPEDVRPHKEQPYYHLLAENETSYYVAYVSQQNLLADDTGEPIGHPQVCELFGELSGGFYEIRLPKTMH